MASKNNSKLFNFIVAIFSILASSGIFATSTPEAIQGPWLTGPLIANPGTTLSAGEFDAEPYFFYDKTFTVPRITSRIPSLSYTQGVGSKMDVQVIVPYAFNEADNRWANGFEDITFLFGVQMITSKQNNWLPNVKLILEQVFPAGKFENLNPTLFYVDNTGEGSYQTGLGVDLEQYFLLPNGSYLNLILNLLYTFLCSVNVHGFNAYGGAFGTNGTVNPGNTFFADLAFEYTLSQHWVVAMDTIYMYEGKNVFHGTPDFANNNENNLEGTLSNQQIQLAPALEYNFNSKWGIIAGVWFTVFNKNSSNFTSWAVALNYSS